MNYLSASMDLDLKTLKFQDGILKNVNSLPFRTEKLIPSAEKYAPTNWQEFNACAPEMKKKIFCLTYVMIKFS